MEYKLKKDLQYEVTPVEEVRGLDSKDKYYIAIVTLPIDKETGKTEFHVGFILKGDINKI